MSKPTKIQSKPRKSAPRKPADKPVVVAKTTMLRMAAVPSEIWKCYSKGSNWKKSLVQQGLIVIAALVCGLLIAHAYKLFIFAPDTSYQNPDSSAAVKQQQKQSGPQGPAQNNAQFSTYPTWTQDFSSSKTTRLDDKYWNALVGPAQNSNNEAQYYTDKPANLRIENGALVFEATHESMPQGYQYASARIESQDKKSFKYGRIDVTAKLPRGVGTWPAIWLLPANNLYEDMNPASDPMRYKNGGEIDILEAVGFSPNVVYGVAHTRNDLTRADETGAFGQTTVPGNDTAYNLYSVLWTPTSITFCVNNQPYYTYSKQPGADYKTWPFDQPFYLILNLAMGGSWGGQDTAQFPGNGIDNNALPASMSVKSIYYYPYVGQ